MRDTGEGDDTHQNKMDGPHKFPDQLLDFAFSENMKCVLLTVFESLVETYLSSG